MKLHDHPKLVLVCSALRAGSPEGVQANIKRAHEYCMVVFAAGHIPLAVHGFYPQFLNEFDAAHRELALKAGLIEVARRDELWFWGYPTRGMKAEILHARNLGKAVYFYDEENPETRVGAFKGFDAEGGLVLTRDITVPAPLPNVNGSHLCLHPERPLASLLTTLLAP